MFATFIDIAVQIPLGPIGFTPVQRDSLRGIERRLGYFGQDRFVWFHYEPRGEEVIWHDSRTYGFGTGAWLAFFDEVQPTASAYRVDVGDERSAGSHVLLIDRVRQCAWFVEKSRVAKGVEHLARGGSATEKGGVIIPCFRPVSSRRRASSALVRCRRPCPIFP